MRTCYDAGMKFLALLLVVFSVGAVESPETLLPVMTDARESWQKRGEAEDALAKLPPEAVLPALLPHMAKGMPSGGIWNSAGREHDRGAPVEWQVFYAVGRSWSAQVNKLPHEGGGRLLHELLRKAPTAYAKDILLGDLALRWEPQAEPTVAAMLKNPKEGLPVRAAAGLVLILHGRENYHALLLEYAGQGEHSERLRWFDLLSDPRHKQRKGVDSRVIAMGFDLIEAERRANPNYVHGGYFLALKVGHYAGQQFKPDQQDPRYQKQGGLNDAFFADTVENALKWWELNKAETLKP
ncbi:MAG: hypothetical protein AB1705_04125 [Verrucomicrobiota bacterium]